MTQIASLPLLRVDVAFNPTDLTSLTQTWTEVTPYVRDFATHGGRQHYLDRIEASTLSMTLDNRTGFFFNGDYSSVTAVSGSGSIVTYTCNNTFTAGSNVTITGVTGGSGGQPYSGTYVVATASSTQFTVSNTQTGAATLSGATAVTRPIIGTRLPIRVLSGWPQKSVTAISGSGSTVTYTVNNTYTPGQQVLVTGSNIAGYNGYFTIATASSTQFTVSSTVTGTADLVNYPTSVGNGYTTFWGVIDTVDTSLADALNTDLYVSASDTLKYLSLRYLYNTQLYAGLATVSSSSSWYNTANRNSYGDNIAGQNGAIVGDYASVDGVLLYDRTQAVDLTNGGTDNTAYLSIPPSSSYGLEFWVIGQAIQSCTLVPLEDTANSNNFSLNVDASGLPFINGATTYLTQPNNINDGYWHHVAVYVSKPGANSLLNLVVDGVLCQTTILRAGGTDGITGLGKGNFLIGQNVACQIDQVVQLKQNITLGQIQNRYVAGSLLRKDCNAGDFIAQALVIGGRGSVSGGTISVPNYLVNGSTYTVGSASNGVVLCQGLLSSTTTSSVLDTLFQAVDTEVGVFYQGDDGVLNFHTRSYLYRPAGNAVATYSFTDDDTSTYHYEANSFQLTRDDVDTWTTVIVSPTNGVPQIYENTANELRWGQSTLTKSTTGTTLDAAYQTAVYLGHVFATPLPRINTLKLMSETDNGSNLDAMLGVNLQDRIHVKRTPINPSAAGLTDTDMSLESLNHEFAADPGYWHTTFTLDPYPIRFSTQSSPTYFLVADDATYGKSDIDVAL